MQNSPSGKRSAAQIQASRANGARSVGPISRAGKIAASASSTTHGLASRCALMPDETAAMYDATVRLWLETFPHRLPGETQILLRAADADFRSNRLARLEENLIAATLKGKLEASDAFKKLLAARNALEGVRALASLAEDIRVAMPVQKVGSLVPAMRNVLDMVIVAGAAPAIARSLGISVESFVLDTIIEVEPESFGAVAAACRAAEVELDRLLPGLEREVQSERERISQRFLLSDSQELRLVDRHRSRISKELDSYLKALKALREAASLAPASSGSSVEACMVELRVVGRAAPR